MEPEEEAALALPPEAALPWRGEGGVTGLNFARLAAAPLFVCGRCTSSFDAAWELHALRPFRDWEAIIALSQSEGRGQLRREWISPPGNLYVSFKPPKAELFSGPPASVLLALLIIEALEDMGLPLKLKWPNDLIWEENGRACKLGGMLLEEKDAKLMAGLGINCANAPDPKALRPDAPLPPTRLPEGFIPRAPLPLWNELVRNIKIIYEYKFLNSSISALLRRAEERLLWRGMDIRIIDETSASGICARLIGLSAQGGLLVREAGGGGRLRELASGGIAPKCEENHA
jgi:BirA family biotin operon repressor/biotin-[acetyl-CoA-carboxylase] ligase